MAVSFSSPTDRIPVKSAELDAAIDGLTTGFAALRIDDQHALIREVEDLTQKTSCIASEEASRIIPIYQKLSQIQLECEHAKSVHQRVLTCDERSVYQNARQFYSQTTAQINRIISKVDTWFQTSQNVFKTVESELAMLHLTVITPKEHSFDKNPDAKKLYEEVKAYFADAKQYVEAKKTDTRWVPITHPKTNHFYENDLAKILESYKEIFSQIRELLRSIAVAEYGNLPDDLRLHGRKLNSIQDDIKKSTKLLCTLDSAPSLLAARNTLRELTEKLCEEEQLLAFIKEFDCSESSIICSAQREVFSFLKCLEFHRKTSEITAEDSFSLAHQAFQACSTLSPVVPSVFSNPFHKKRVQFLYNVVSIQASRVFDLTDDEKAVLHALLCDQEVTADVVKAYLTKSAAQYLFYNDAKKEPNVEVEIVKHIKKGLSQVDDVVASYFSQIAKFKMDDNQLIAKFKMDDKQLNSFVEVLRFIHQNLLEQDRNPLLFLQAWHRYFQLTTICSNMQLHLCYLATLLNSIAASNTYFQIDPKDLNTLTQRFSLPGFVKALGEAIWEEDITKLDAANVLVRYCLQEENFNKLISAFRTDAYFLISLNLQRKIKEEKFAEIIPQECAAALQHGFIKERLDAEGSRVLEQDLLPIAQILFFVEKVDLRRDFEMSQFMNTPVLAACVDKYGLERFKEWYTPYYKTFAAKSASSKMITQ